jgi:hypothetical protein
VGVGGRRRCRERWGWGAGEVGVGGGWHESERVSGQLGLAELTCRGGQRGGGMGVVGVKSEHRQGWWHQSGDGGQVDVLLEWRGVLRMGGLLMGAVAAVAACCWAQWQPTAEHTWLQ